MNIPARIAKLIEAVVANSPHSGGGHVDEEAAKYGGVALMGTLGAIWLLRADGTLWEVDDETGRPLAPLPAEWHDAAVVCGAQRYPWLAELVPVAPASAQLCEMCNGHGILRSGAFCPACRTLGWRRSAP